MYLFSIIVPVYNCSLFIKECIDSIKKQSLENWELLLIDDGSTDSSPAICDDQASIDTRIRVFHKLNGGVSSARNLGIEKAKGNYILFLDSDDMLSSDTLKICQEHISTSNLDVLQFGLTNRNVWGDVDGKYTSALNAQEYIKNRKYSVCAGGSIIRASIIKEADIKFVEKLKLAEDQLFIMDCISNSKFCKKIQDRLYFYRPNPNSITHNILSNDALNTIRELTSFRSTHTQWASSIDKECVILFVEIIKNDDFPTDNIAMLYEKSKVSNMLEARGVYFVFMLLAQLSINIAIRFIKMRYLK